MNQAPGRFRKFLTRAILLPLLLLAFANPCSAWTNASRRQLLQAAVPLMPASLRRMMERYQKDLAAAMLAPGSKEDHPDHWQHPDGEYGSAATRAAREADALTKAMNSHRPLSEVVRHFGALAHWVADVNNPLHAADRDSGLAGYYSEYQAYLEEQLPRFPLVFEGYRSPTLSAAGPAAYLMESAARSREYAEPIRRAYGPDGARSSPEAFDERSLAFGVGSLSYSKAVNDIVRVWLWAWESSHGDTSETPYPLDPAPDVADRSSPAPR